MTVLAFLCMTATTAFAKDYNIWVKGIQVTDANKSNVLGDGKVEYIPAIRTLYLYDNCHIVVGNSFYEAIKIGSGFSYPVEIAVFKNVVIEGSTQHGYPIIKVQSPVIIRGHNSVTGYLDGACDLKCIGHNPTDAITDEASSTSEHGFKFQNISVAFELDAYAYLVDDNNADQTFGIGDNVALKVSNTTGTRCIYDDTQLYKTGSQDFTVCYPGHARWNSTTHKIDNNAFKTGDNKELHIVSRKFLWGVIIANIKLYNTQANSGHFGLCDTIQGQYISGSVSVTGRHGWIDLDNATISDWGTSSAGAIYINKAQSTIDIRLTGNNRVDNITATNYTTGGGSTLIISGSAHGSYNGKLSTYYIDFTGSHTPKNIEFRSGKNGGYVDIAGAYSSSSTLIADTVVVEDMALRVRNTGSGPASYANYFRVNNRKAMVMYPAYYNAGSGIVTTQYGSTKAGNFVIAPWTGVRVGAYYSHLWNANDICNDGGKVQWNSSTHTLTLNGFNVTSDHDVIEFSGTDNDRGASDLHYASINVQGTNTITNTQTDPIFAGIYTSLNNLYINGSGTLNLDGPNGASGIYLYSGSNGNLTISGGVTVKANGGGYGLHGNGGRLTVTGSTVEATGSSEGSIYGFTAGITLTNCAITQPAGATVSGSKVVVGGSLCKSKVVITAGAATHYNIAITEPSHGSIVTTPAAQAAANDNVQIHVNTDAGYRVKAGSVTVTKAGGGTVTVTGSGNDYSFTMPAANVTITATTEAIPTYTVTIATLTGGSITASPINNIPAGTTVQLTIVPQAGYTYKAGSLKVTKAGGSTVTTTGSGTNYTFTMPAANVTVTATFVAESTPVDLAESEPTVIDSWQSTARIIVPETANAVIYTLSGQTVRTLQLQAGENLVSDLPAGLYIVRVSNGATGKVAIR